MAESFVIQSNQTDLLRERIPDINDKFGVRVEIQKNPKVQEVDENQWVQITGKDQDKVLSAKNYIIALCCPELNEKITFPGFPVYIFEAFKGKCKDTVEMSCEVVIKLQDEEWIILQGSNFGVTMATSKISHLARLLKDKNTITNIKQAKRFDALIEELNENEEMKRFPNSLKKEILEMLGMNNTLLKETADFIQLPDTDTDTDTTMSNLDTTNSSMYENLHSNIPSIDSSVIVISDETDANDESVVIISDDSEMESQSDDDDTMVSNGQGQVQGDGIEFDMSYILPPTFAIVEWLKVHYQGTNDPTNYVSKRDMLEHFRSHFDIPDHPELANAFFDKLAVTVFKSDPNYRCVKTKKCKNKHSRRRLVCLRRKTVVEDLGQTSRSPDNRQSSPNKSSTMSDWNANRIKENAKPVNPGPVINEPPVTIGSPKQPQPIPIPPSESLSNWLSGKGPYVQPPTVNATRASTPYIQSVIPVQRQPIPMQSAPMNVVQPVPRPVNNPYKSLALRVSQMSNEELLSDKRPRINPGLRPVVIDGSNVAISHGSQKSFSCRGIALCVRYFMERGHGQITCFVPNYRKGGGGNPPSSDASLLFRLENMGILKCTPSRRVRGENIVCYDDRFIVELAAANNGVILSNDQYRDLMLQNSEWRKIIEERLLQYTMVGDLLMLPQDPHGRKGPSLEEFLILQDSSRSRQRNTPLLPTPQMIRPVYHPRQPPPNPASLFPQQLPLRPPPSRWAPAAPNKAYPVLTTEEENQLVEKMLVLFPGRDQDIRLIIRAHPLEKDIGKLSNYFLIKDTGN